MKTPMNRFAILTLSLGLFLLLVSCSKEDNTLSFYWEQTLCADPWGGNGSSPSLETEAAVRNFLEDQNIEVEDISVDDSSKLDVTCLACTCLNGVRIIVQVKSQYSEDMLALKFKAN